MNMNSQTYLTNPTLWLNFYRNMANNKFNPYKYRRQKKNQVGRGLHGRFRGSYMVPVNPNAMDDTDSTTVNTKLVTPVAAAEQRAESELKEQKENNKPHVKILKAIKRSKSKKRVIKKKASKRSSSKSKSNRKYKKSRKRKLNKDYQDSVWNQPVVKKRRKI